MRAAAALAIGIATALPAGAAPALPDPVRAELPELRLVGESRFRHLLFHVYDAALWTAGARWTPDAAFVLDIRYAMRIAGRDLARRSVEEMRKQGERDEARLARWARAMDAIFPDVAEGDRLVGVHVPGWGARFFDARGPRGDVADPEFARAFFGIWLAPATSEPQLRRELLGEAR